MYKCCKVTLQVIYFGWEITEGAILIAMNERQTTEAAEAKDESKSELLDSLLREPYENQ